MMIRVHRLFAILAVAATILAASSAPQADPSRYVTDIKALASPEMEGRGAGTRGLIRAEHLIEKRYKELHMEQPQRLLQAVNQLFCENTAARAFATLLFVEYNNVTRRLRYANCGHLPALILRSDDGLETLDATSTVVGLFDRWECEIGESRLSAGDTLVFYTDGVTESFNDLEEQYGQERLIEALRRNRELDAPALLRTIVDEVRRFGREKQHDDITLVAAKCR